MPSMLLRLRAPALAAALSLCGLACPPDPGHVIGDDDSSPTPTPTPTPATPIPSPTPTATPTPTPAYDCAAIPPAPLSLRTLNGPRGYHGLAFDHAGMIVGSDGSSLIRSDYAGNWTVFVPNLGSAEQMDYLPNGDLALTVSWSGDLHRVTPAGGRSLIAANLGAYGVLVGPDGMIYAAGGTEVNRIDPATGVRTLLGEFGGDDEAHSLDFSPDHRRLYIGTNNWAGIIGTLYVLHLDANLNPMGPPEVFATVGEGWHDGIAVDACGNLYVVDFWTFAMYRIDPNGAVSLYHNWGPGGTDYGHATVFGNGIGGWRIDAIYAPMPYNDNLVQEIVIGAPSRHWLGQVINAP
jgi:hypothetical protein